MSDLGFNVWGALASAAGVLFALYPAFRAWVRPRLPTSLLPEILAMYKETQELYATALQNGLIDDRDELYLCNRDMVAISIGVDSVRAQVYAIASWRQDVGQWWSGLSHEIRLLGKQLNAFRMGLAEQNSSKLKLMASQGLLLGERSLLSQDSKCNASDSSNVPITSPPPPDAYYHRPAMAIRYGLYPDNRPQPNEYGATLPAGAKAQDSSSGLAGHGVPSVSASQDPGVLTANPPHQLILKALADISRMLERALNESRHCPTQSKSCPNHVPIHSSKQLEGRGRTARRSPAGSSSKSPKRDALHARLQGLERLLRRLYGLRARTRTADMSGKNEVVLDPESLAPLGVNGNDSDTDGNSDEWEEECQ
ncbi:hypothetical protein PYCCODRAFT_1468931 [Trametes coccinea BRFM310]|uniref:Uncharacterized protein n=1 Tax=Trametes coccinea (strain BRFM310) TaxID=1353009 RepID=A0A1Y2III2_TRAC3|nr:hypothetical protein PYCCODRAFT_1468931 [Trametes coccinea BRFM310]